MRKNERKKRLGTGVLSGLIGSLLSLTVLLSVLAVLLRCGRLGEALLRLLLPLCCLLSGIVGAVLSAGSGERRTRSLLLSGTIPSGLLLCFSAMVCDSGEADRLLLWNCAALLLPPVLALLPGAGKRRHGRR